MEDAQLYLGRLIGRTHKFIRAWGDRELAPLDATVTDWILLFHIGTAPEPGLSQTEVARFADMGDPALVRHLDRMEHDGLVVRTRDAEDRRIFRVTLTAAGQARMNELRVVIDDCDKQMRSILTDNEQRVLARSLDKLFAFALERVV